MASASVYLVFTKTFGIIQKTEVNIKAARAWAKRALGADVVSVQRLHKGGVSVGELEAEWLVIAARRWPAVRVVS